MKSLLLLLLFTSSLFAQNEPYNQLIEPILPESTYGLDEAYYTEEDYMTDDAYYNDGTYDSESEYIEALIMHLPSDHSDDSYYSEPLLPELPPRFSLENLPVEQQILISSAIQVYREEQATIDCEFAVAIGDILHQKTTLEYQLEELPTRFTGIDLEIQRIAITTVIKEKETMLHNLRTVREQRDRMLHARLKIRIIEILHNALHPKTTPVNPETTCSSIF